MNTYRITTNKKYCSYHKCGNNSLANPSVTFFSFPKRRDRCETWIKAAGVSRKAAGDRMYRYLCELHFPSIYICRSQRRTLLLGTAVPFSFDEIGEDSEKNEMLEIVEEEMIDSEDLPEEFFDDKESTDGQGADDSMPADDQTYSVDSGKTINNMPEVNRKPSMFVYTRKRKNVDGKMLDMKVKVLNSTGTPKTLNTESNIKTLQLDGNSVRLVPVETGNNAQQQTLRLTPVNEKKSTIVEEAPKEVFKATLKSPVSSSTNAIEIIEQNEDTSTSKSSDDMAVEKDDKISEFIFKGEEYVQMPKEHYLKKVNKLKRSLAFYENIVRNMRDVLDHADPSSSLEC